MILVDTSVWVDHLRRGDSGMRRLLEEDDVSMHPFVIGELSLGHINPRNEILEFLRSIPPAQVAEEEEVVSFIGAHRLYGVGIGYVDAHLLASAWLGPDTRLWTRDQRVRKIARDLAIEAPGLN